MPSRAVTIIEWASPLSAAIPGVGDAVGAALDLAKMVAQAAENAKVLKEDCRKLGERAVKMTNAVVNETRNLGPERQAKLNLDMSRLLQALKDCEAFAQETAKVPKFKRFIKRNKFKDRLDECNDELDEAFDLFDLQSLIRHEIHTEQTQMTMEGGFTSFQQTLTTVRGGILQEISQYDARRRSTSEASLD